MILIWNVVWELYRLNLKMSKVELEKRNGTIGKESIQEVEYKKENEK